MGVPALPDPPSPPGPLSPGRGGAGTGANGANGSNGDVHGDRGRRAQAGNRHRHRGDGGGAGHDDSAQPGPQQQMVAPQAMWAPMFMPGMGMPGGGGGGDGGDEQPIDWRRYVDAVRVRFWMVLALIVAAGGIATMTTMRQPKMYRSSTSIVFDGAAPKVLVEVEEFDTAAQWAKFSTELQIMQSRAVARRAAEKLGLVADDARNGLASVADPVEREARRAAMDPADLVAGRYSVRPDREAAIAYVGVEDTDADFTAALANAVAEAYVEMNLEKRVDGTRDAGSWLAVQLQDLKRKLELSENALYDFLEKNNILSASLDSQLDEVRQRLSAFNANLAAVQADRIKRELDSIALSEARVSPAILDTLAELQSAELVSALKGKLLSLRGQRTELASKYQDEHPRMKALDDQINQVEAELEREIDVVLINLERQQASIAHTEEGLKKAVAEERQKEARLNRLTLEYARLKRDVDTNAKLYDMMTSRMKEADITGSLPFNNVRVLDKAQVPKKPFKPNLPQSVALGLLLGLVLGVTLALGLELLDNTVKTQDDVEKTLAAPFLGLLPVLETGGATGTARSGKNAKERAERAAGTLERDLFVIRNPKSSAAECARFIRTNLLFMSPDTPLRSIALTSPAPEEGKTTTAISLAATMAVTGSRTLIVDTDMRRPRLHRAFSVSNDHGLSSVIVGEATLDQAIQKTEMALLDVLPCGPIPPNPAELLHTDRFAELVRELEDRYDRVIFDAPPVGAVADPAVLATVTDGIVLVVKCDKTRKDSAKHALRVLRDAHVNVLGVVLNDVDLDEKRYGAAYYAYYRRYGEYYGEGDGASSTRVPAPEARAAPETRAAVERAGADGDVREPSSAKRKVAADEPWVG